MTLNVLLTGLCVITAALPIICGQTSFKLSDVENSMQRLDKASLDDVGPSIGPSVVPAGFEFVSGETNHEIFVSSDGSADSSICRIDRAQQGPANAFVNAFVTAWAKHLPLEVSADDWWTAIALGVAQHMAQPNISEAYRKQFVNHEGKLALTVLVPQSVFNDPRAETNKQAWSDAIGAMAGEIKQNTKTAFASIMTKSFSTTGPVERTVIAAALMDAVKAYFEYEFQLICGIPQVILHGSLKDYKDILDRIGQLMVLFPDLNWWLAKIRSHMESVADTVEGKIDHKWWKGVVFQEEVDRVCAKQTRLTGWIGDFMPYSCEDHDGVSGACKRNDGKREKPSLTGFSRPLMSLTEATLKNNAGEKIANLTLAAGFTGISQAAETKAVRPVLGWLLYMKKL